MKCKSCETEINPKWKHAIDTNKCPFCGAEIMDEELKNLFLTLSATIDQLSKYPDQLNDWMLLNHSYIKTDSPNLVSFLPKNIIDDLNNELEKTSTIKVKVSDGEEEEVEVKKIQSDTKTDEFFKRAEAFKPSLDGFENTTQKTQHLKNMVAQIKKTGKPGGGGNVLLSEEDGEGLDAEELAELSSMSDFGAEEEIPAAVLAIANSRGGNSSVNHKDLLLLQRMQDKVANARESFEGGSNRGKNGFSRSG